jgi:hypothetical protein
MGIVGPLHCHRPNTLAGIHKILNGRYIEVMNTGAEPEVITRAGKNPVSLFISRIIIKFAPALLLPV